MCSGEITKFSYLCILFVATKIDAVFLYNLF